MANLVGAGAFALGATIMGGALPAPRADAPKEPTAGRCDACLEVCSVPLSYEDDLLDESTDNYMSAAPREVATAAAIEMATRLKSLHRDYQGGYFGAAYEAHAGDIESLAGKQAGSDHPASAEIRALKRVRTALYADAVVELRALAQEPPSQEFLAAYRARVAVLDGVLESLLASQHMRAAERFAVCDVLAHRP